MKRYWPLMMMLLSGVSVAQAQQQEGTVTRNLMSVFSGINSVFSGICLIVGIGLIFASFLQYKQHRLNKLLVPISKPIVWFILGIVLVLVPILGHFTMGGQLAAQG